MRKFLNLFARDEKGATAIEYGLIAALIAVPMITVLPGIGDKLKSAFQTVDTALGNAASDNGTGADNTGDTGVQ